MIDISYLETLLADAAPRLYPQVKIAFAELRARRLVEETWRAYKDFGDHGDPIGDPSYYQEVEELKDRHTEAVAKLKELMK